MRVTHRIASDGDYVKVEWEDGDDMQMWPGNVQIMSWQTAAELGGKLLETVKEVEGETDEG